MNNLRVTRKIEITLQTEKGEFVVEKVEPVSPKNMLLMKTKNRGAQHE